MPTMFHKHGRRNLRGVNRRIAYEPCVVLIFFFLLSRRCLLGLSTNHLSGAGLAADIKTWHCGPPPGTPLINDTPQAATHDLKRLLVELKLSFRREVGRLAPLL